MLVCKQSLNLINILKHCKSIKQIHQVHAQIITRGLLSLHQSSSSLLLTHLLHYFTSFLTTPPPSHHHVLINYAVSIFHRINKPSNFCYNTIIRAHTLLSFPQNAILFFTKMRQYSVPPDFHTFPFVLKASAKLRCRVLPRTLHCQSFKFGISADIYVCNTLICVYRGFDDVHDAYKVFDESSYRDVVSYNAMIDGLVKAKETKRARELFERMPFKDAVSWGTLMAGYLQMNQCRQVIELLDQMTALRVRPNNIALVSALSACAQLGELEKGKSVHDYIQVNRIRIDSFLSTGLVNLYAKCGCIETAREIFESSREKNVFTWNAMLVGLAMHGYGYLSLDYFSRMVEARVQPDGVTFLGVLVGCSHSGLVDEAIRIFAEMECVYGIYRELKHYGCMVDLLGRAGLIKEATEMIEAMPMDGGVFVWGGLLGGCRIHANIEFAEKAAKHVLEIKPEDGGTYSVLADIYANADRWDDLARIRRLRDSKRVKKNAGCSLIQLNGLTHEFVAGDSLHPQSDDIYLVLTSIGQNQREAPRDTASC